MNPFPYMPLFPADYIADTYHLTTEEHGAYFLIMMNYWQRGKPPEANDMKLAGIARLDAPRWAAMRDKIKEFFTEKDGLLYHERIEEELDKVREKAASASAAGRASADKRKGNARSTPVQRPMNGSATDVQRPFNPGEGAGEGERIYKNTTGLDSHAPPAEESDNDFLSVAAACCSLLRVGKLSREDQETISLWCESVPNFMKEALPVIAKKLDRYRSRNNGKNPGNLSYFNKALSDIIPAIGMPP